MADEYRSRGPMMLVATEALHPPKLRIGKIGQNFTLPRTVPAIKLGAGFAGAFLGIVVIAAITGFRTAPVMYGATIGAILGVGLVSYSPLKDESLARWFGLKVRSRGKRQRMVDGKTVRVAVGICYIDPPERGAVRVRHGAVAVRPGTHDDRGVRIAEMRWKMPVAPDAATVPASTPRSATQFAKLRAASGGSNVSVALGSWRSATAEQALPEGFVPPPIDPPKNRFGKWRQDAAALRELYDRPVEDAFTVADLYDDASAPDDPA